MLALETVILFSGRRIYQIQVFFQVPAIPLPAPAEILSLVAAIITIFTIITIIIIIIIIIIVVVYKNS